MKNKEDIIKELEELAPELAQFKTLEKERTPPPANFFEQLPSQLLTQMQLEKKPVIQTKAANPIASFIRQLATGRIFRQPQYTLGFGIVLGLIISIALFNLYESPNTLTAEIENMEPFEDVSKQALFDYVITNIEDFDSEDILEVAEELPIDLLIPDQIIEDEDIDAVIDELTDQIDWSTIL